MIIVQRQDLNFRNLAIIIDEIVANNLYLPLFPRINLVRLTIVLCPANVQPRDYTYLVYSVISILHKFFHICLKAQFNIKDIIVDDLNISFFFELDAILFSI